MKLWLVRAGREGEYETKFLEEGRIYLTWRSLNTDLAGLESQEKLREVLAEKYPDSKPNQIKNWASQIWAFAKRMQPSDWVVLPSKKKSVIHFGEITGEYRHEPSGPDPFFHHRSVKWPAIDIPRSNFDQDILYSFGSCMTICRIKKNDAESRIMKMSKNRWQPTDHSLSEEEFDDLVEGSDDPDIERFAKDQIAKSIKAKYSGHGMVRLVEAILKAKGFSTYRSPEGPDKGADLLAAPGALGFGNPKICVQVKSGDSAVDRPALDQLIGTMQNFCAESGLFVSWSGFKSSVDKETAAQFFRVRLWDQDVLIKELLECYESLDEELKAELPLKRIWVITNPDS